MLLKTQLAFRGLAITLSEKAAMALPAILKPTTCIDLRPWADEHRYRWRYEEGHNGGEADAEWFVEVVCKYGLIYPHGGLTLLAYATQGKKRLLRAIPGAEHLQSDGGGEVFRFPADRLDEVAAILKPRRRRQYSPGHQAVLRERLESLRQMGPQSH
jgi:hypothetical protein